MTVDLIHIRVCPVLASVDVVIEQRGYKGIFKEIRLNALSWYKRLTAGPSNDACVQINCIHSPRHIQSLRFLDNSQTEHSLTPAAVRQTCCIWMAGGQPPPLIKVLSQLFWQHDPPAFIFRITAAAKSSRR